MAVHLEKAVLPPHPFPFHALSGTTRAPSLGELKCVFGLQPLAQSLAHYCRRLRSGEYHLDALARDEGPGIKAVWQERLHSAVYRMCIAGAALCQPYQEPFLSDQPDCPPNLYGRVCQLTQRTTNPSIPSDPAVHSYLLRFPVFDFEAVERHDDAFGPLLDFLVRISGERARREDLTTNNNNHDPLLSDFLSRYPNPLSLAPRPAQILFHELNQLLFICETVYSIMLNHTSFAPSTLPYLRPSRPLYPVRATIVPFASFTPMEVNIPAPPHYFYPGTIQFESLTPGALLRTSYMESAGLVMVNLWRNSSPHSHRSPMAEPSRQFFRYAFRKGLGMKFSEQAFKLRNWAFWTWRANPYVFSDRFRTWRSEAEGVFISREVRQ